MDSEKQKNKLEQLKIKCEKNICVALQHLITSDKILLEIIDIEKKLNNNDLKCYSNTIYNCILILKQILNI